MITPSPSPFSEEAAVDELASMARGRCKVAFAQFLARHVLRIYSDARDEVERAAMAAVVERLGAVRRERVRVVAAPRRSAAGAYRLRAAGQAQSYAVTLQSAEPLHASCDCDDFARNALGVCVHVLTVLVRLARRDGFAAAKAHAAAGLRISWDPVRPLEGAGDWLERVRIEGPSRDLAAEVWKHAPSLRGFMRRVDRGAMTVSDAHSLRLARRLELVRALLALLTSLEAGGSLAEPALGRLLAGEQVRLERAVAVEDGMAELEASLMSLGRTPYRYQREGIERFLRQGVLVLGDDMGLGKTLQAAAACHALYATGRVSKGLVVVPASLKRQWQREWGALTDAPVTLVEGSPDKRRALYAATERGFLLVNYEAVLRDLEALRAWGPDLVVLDEAQRIKNAATKTASALRELRPAWRLALTGTPLENRLDDLASIVGWVDDTALEPRWRLTPHHAVVSESEAGARGVRGLRTLRARVAHCVLRRSRADVSEQLPSRTDTTVPVKLTEPQREEHDALDAPIAVLAAIAKRRPLTPPELQRLMLLLARKRIVANGLALATFESTWAEVARERPTDEMLEDLCSPKLAALRDLLEQILIVQGRKVVVFSEWARMLDLASWATSELLRAHGVRAVFFSGRETLPERDRSVTAFHEDPAVRVLFATNAGGVGLNLQRAASCCVNLELPWNPAVREQRISRVFRAGQALPVDVYDLVTAGSIEERIGTLLSDKSQLFRGLFDRSSDEIKFEGSTSFLQRLDAIAPAMPVRRVPARRDEPGAAKVEPPHDDDGAPTLAPDPRPAESLANTPARAPGALPAHGVAAAELPEGVPARPQASFSSGGEPAVESVSVDPLCAHELQRRLEAARVTHAPPVPAGLQIETRPDGHLHIDVSPAAAALLAPLLAGLADVLRAHAARR